MTTDARVVYVLAACQYFICGMETLFASADVTLRFIRSIDEVVVPDEGTLTVLLVLDMSGSESLKKFRDAVDFLNQINSPRRTGVLVSQYNAYLTYYFYRKFSGRVTFFNSHNLRSGLFQRNFLTWLKGNTFCPARVVFRFRDDRYGFSLKEWISLVVPLSGETVQDMARCLKVSAQSLYQIRINALKKIGIPSYKEFCRLFIRGEIRTENNRITRT